MALKYRIVYEHYPRYKKHNPLKRSFISLSVLLLCTALILIYLYPPIHFRIRDTLFAGNTAIIPHAFEQLTDAISRGEALVDALDAFCETVTASR